jgi:hypothetical protein
MPANLCRDFVSIGAEKQKYPQNHNVSISLIHKTLRNRFYYSLNSPDLEGINGILSRTRSPIAYNGFNSLFTEFNPQRKKTY